MDELADHLSLEIDKLKMPDLAAKFKGKKAIADQWVKDVSDSMETFYNNEVKNLKQNIKKQVEDLQKIASEGVGNAKNKAQDYQKLTKQWSDDASKALKELYENEVKNFQPNLQKEMAELKSLISKQVGKLKKSTSLTAENVSKWVDDVSGTLKKLYKEKVEAFQRNLQKQAEKFKKTKKESGSKKGKKNKRRNGELPKGVTKNTTNLGDGMISEEFLFEVQDQTINVGKVLFDKYKNSNVSMMGFAVNDMADMIDDALISPKERTRAALKIKGIFDHIISTLEEGHIMQATPYMDDGFGESRISIYKKMGFVMGEKGNMYAIVKNGEIESIPLKEIKNIDKVISKPF
jgi:hypothetical protein